MKQSGTVSWTFSADAPSDLNFAIYVASALGILTNDSVFSHDRLWPGGTEGSDHDETHDMLRQQWLEWWLAMVSEKCHNVHVDQRTGERPSMLFEPTESRTPAFPVHNAF